MSAPGTGIGALAGRLQDKLAVSRTRIDGVVSPHVVRADPNTFRPPWPPDGGPPATMPGVRSQPCTFAQMSSATHASIAADLGEAPHRHRKLWEYCFIIQALHEGGAIGPGRHGLGFGVGREPIASHLAARGCHILATDLDAGEAAERGWVDTGQHSDALDTLNERGLCPPEEFARLVSFRPLDMRAIPAELDGGFDFTWSSCAFEHLGSIRAGLHFIRDQMRCLRPGGLAVHTTELNLSSNRLTIHSGPTVLFRRRDIEALARDLRHSGHHLELCFDLGHCPPDAYVDEPPYGGDSHLRLRLGAYTTTSFGLIVRAGGTAPDR